MNPARGPRLAYYFAVGIGGALGGAARWLLADWLQGTPGDGIPWATLVTNVTGSFLIGFYAARIAPGGRWHHHSPEFRLFFMTGFCGGYTTFSIFSLETFLLAQAGRTALAAAYVAGSIVLWLGGVWAGYSLGRQARWGAAR